MASRRLHRAATFPSLRGRPSVPSARPTAHDARPAMQADSHDQSAPELIHGADEVEGRSHRLLGGVLVRVGIAEQDEEAVAE